MEQAARVRMQTILLIQFLDKYKFEEPYWNTRCGNMNEVHNKKRKYFITQSDVKECHGLSYNCSKRAGGILPHTIDRMSKYITACMTRVRQRAIVAHLSAPTIIVNATSSRA